MTWEVDYDATDEIGRLADKVDSYIAAAKLPMPAKFHLEQLMAGLGEVSSKLKEIYTALSGANPWEDKE